MIEWTYTIEEPTAIEAASSVDDTELLPIRDLALDSDGDLEVPLRIVSGVEAIAQRLRIRLSIWFGEWFLDTREGIKYIEQVLADPRVSATSVKALLSDVILSSVGISAIQSMDVSISARVLSISFVALTKGGSVLFLGGYNRG